MGANCGGPPGLIGRAHEDNLPVAVQHEAGAVTSGGINEETAVLRLRFWHEQKGHVEDRKQWASGSLPFELVHVVSERRPVLDVWGRIIRHPQAREPPIIRPIPG